MPVAGRAALKVILGATVRTLGVARVCDIQEDAGMQAPLRCLGSGTVQGQVFGLNLYHLLCISVSVAHGDPKTKVFCAANTARSRIVSSSALEY